MDAALGGFVLFERIEGDAVEHREVLRGMAGAFAIQVLAEADIEHPMQFVLDAPVLATGCIQPLRIGPQAGDVVADFALCFAGGPPRRVVTLGLDQPTNSDQRDRGKSTLNSDASCLKVVDTLRTDLLDWKATL